MPGRILAGDAYVITQGSGAASINASLAENLTLEAWASIVSPEILDLGTLAGEPVLVRAAEPDAFLRLEGGTWVERAIVGEVAWAFAGEGLGRRLGLGTGETVTLVGSGLPRIAFARISGIYRSATPANDELVVDYGMGRFLGGLGPTSFHSIRVRTADVAALLAFLGRFGASVHVSGPGVAQADVNSDPTTDERIANIILRTGVGGTPRDYLASLVTEATTSVRVVAYGIAALLAVLVAFGIHAVQGRAFADRAGAVGVLRAVGAGNRWMRIRLLMETVPLASLAGVLGSGLGLLVQMVLQPRASVVVFGHAVLISFDATTLGSIVAAVVALSGVSGLVLLGRELRARPIESMRETPAVEPPQSLEVVLRG